MTRSLIRGEAPSKRSTATLSALTTVRWFRIGSLSYTVTPYSASVMVRFSILEPRPPLLELKMMPS